MLLIPLKRIHFMSYKNIRYLILTKKKMEQRLSLHSLKASCFCKKTCKIQWRVGFINVKPSVRLKMHLPLIEFESFPHIWLSINTIYGLSSLYSYGPFCVLHFKTMFSLYIKNSSLVIFGNIVWCVDQLIIHSQISLILWSCTIWHFKTWNNLALNNEL